MELKDKAYRLVAKTRQRAISFFKYVCTSIEDVPCVGPVQRAQDVEQGTLACTTFSNYRNDLAPLDRKRSAPEDIQTPTRASRIALLNGFSREELGHNQKRVLTTFAKRDPKVYVKAMEEEKA